MVFRHQFHLQLCWFNQRGGHAYRIDKKFPSPLFFLRGFKNFFVHFLQIYLACVIKNREWIFWQVVRTFFIRLFSIRSPVILFITRSE
ncbi:hypothetical protein CW304_18785 [Bacillus sp. UFRGS-B20]|nr:hypothetical protein CW304_18785 [Bacillus sp. UFRGS-B20]